MAFSNNSYHSAAQRLVIDDGGDKHHGAEMTMAMVQIGKEILRAKGYIGSRITTTLVQLGLPWCTWVQE